MPAALLLAALALPLSDVLVVAPTGAPYATLQQAVDAAQDGDVVLIRAGTYGGCVVDSKSVALVADVPGAVTLTTPTTLRNLDPTEAVTLAGVNVRPTNGGGVRVLSNQGAVRLIALGSVPPVAADTLMHAVEVSASTDVALLGCDLSGGSSSGAFPSLPGAGLSVWDSRVTLHDTALVGGRGSDAQYVGAGGSSFPALAGAAGCIVEGASEVHCAGSRCVGGEGGRGLAGLCAPFVVSGGAGASGGPGLRIEPAATVRVQDSVLLGGVGGPGGAGGAPCGTAAGSVGPTGDPVVGQSSALPGATRRLRAPTHVRELTSLSIEVVGAPGERAFLQVGSDTQWAFAPALGGVRLVGDTSRRLSLGTVPSSGVLLVALPIPDLGPGVAGVWNHLQVFAVDSSGAIRIGGAREVVLLDAAF